MTVKITEENKELVMTKVEELREYANVSRMICKRVFLYCDLDIDRSIEYLKDNHCLYVGIFDQPQKPEQIF